MSYKLHVLSGLPSHDDGLQIGVVGEKLGFFGATPSGLPASASLGVVAVTSSQNATTNGSDAGTTQTLANALKVSFNAAQVDIAAVVAGHNALRAALLTLGLHKGSA